jgi:formate dehydrogenase iron-sulfur subunit
MIGILVDVTRCNGCNRCVEACALANELAAAPPTQQEQGDGLSANRWTAIVYTSDGTPVRKFCRHCLEPACVSVCPVGAMIKTEAGPVIYDSSRCMGCRYCMMACPFGIPRYEWESAAPLVRKCTLCYERLGHGELPACVQACPEQVLAFGERDALMQEAYRRIEAAPHKYLPVVYGEHEAGGTSVLYISDTPLNLLSLAQQPASQPLPELSMAWLDKVPALGLATAGLMTGLLWVIGRRMQADEAWEARQKKEH